MNEITQLLDYSPMLLGWAALNALGKILKMWEKFPDEWIPPALLVAGVVIYWSFGNLAVLNGQVVPPVSRCLIGIVAASLAISGHQFVKQLGNGKATNETLPPTPPAS